jgi:hypothetical protein
MKIATAIRPQAMNRWLASWGVLGILGLAFFTGEGQPAGQENKPALPPDLSRIAPDAFLVETFQIDAIWNSAALKNVREKALKQFPDLLQEFERAVGVDITDIERMTLVMLGVKENSEPILLLLTKKAYDKERVLKTVLPKHVEKKTDKATIYISRDRNALSFLDDRVYVFGTAESVEAFVVKPIPPKEGPLSPALQAAAAGKHTITAGVNPEPVAMLKDELPAEAEPFKPLIAAKSPLLTVDLTDKLSCELRGTFANAREAENAEKAVEQLRQLAIGLLGNLIEKSAKQSTDGNGTAALLKFAESAVKRVEVERKDAMLQASLSVNAEPAMAALIGSMQKIREAAQRVKSSNNLKQFAVGMFNYLDKHGTFPAAASFDKNGKPLLSWRVTILPYIEEEKLYKEFQLDEPWDSEHNKKLIEKMPPVYLMPDDDPKKHLTRYRVFVGKGAFFEGTRGLRIKDISDGLSNTIMIVEAPNGVPWTKPEDLVFDDGKLLPRVVDPKRNGFMAALGDGSVRFFKKTIKESTLRLYVKRDDGWGLPADDD